MSTASADSSENEALLKSLGLAEVRIEPKKAPRPKPKPKPKRQEVDAAEFVDNGDDESDEEVVTPRRSGRARTTARRYVTAVNGTEKAKQVNGRAGQVNGKVKREPSPESDDERQPQRKAQRLGVRTEDP